VRSIRLGCPVIGLEQTQEIEMGEMADFERDYGNGREGTGGVHKKLYTMPTLKRVGKKDWKCTLCSKDILKGVEHHYWRSPADGYTENRVHLKCFEKIMERGVHEYKTRTKKTPPLPDNAEITGRTLAHAEFPKGAGENGYWKEGVPLYSTPPLEVRESAKCGYCGGSGSVNSWTTATSSDICFKCNGAGTATAKGE